MPEAQLLWSAAFAFVLGGFVKGTLGIGLPLVAIPVMSLAGWPAAQAIALACAPVMVSNLWQMHDTGISWPGVRRFLPLMSMLVLFTVLTVPLTLSLPERALRAVLAAVVVLAVVLNALPLKLDVAPERERWWSAGIGAASGVMGGVSALTGPLIITYLMSLRLAREVFVGTISVIYLSSSVPLYTSMAAQGRLGWHEAGLSALALAPMAVGLAAGKAVRGRLGETVFRRILLGFLVAVAVLMVLR
jgi:uncharacterized membrane protein YfcA